MENSIRIRIDRRKEPVLLPIDSIVRLVKCDRVRFTAASELESIVNEARQNVDTAGATIVVKTDRTIHADGG